MAFPTAMNDQITDSISQVNLQTVGVAPSVASTNALISTSQAMANAAHNATLQQQNAATHIQSATTVGLMQLLNATNSVIGRSRKSKQPSPQPVDPGKASRTRVVRAPGSRSTQSNDHGDQAIHDNDGNNAFV